LEVDEAVASKRILWAHRKTDHFKTPEAALTEVKERNLKDQQRYKKLYAVDVWDYKQYNLVVDTSQRTPEEILDIILAEFKARKIKKGIGETETEQRAISKAKHKKSLLKNLLLLLALIVIVGIWMMTVMLAK
jgi:hypothetical protein